MLLKLEETVILMDFSKKKKEEEDVQLNICDHWRKHKLKTRLVITNSERGV